MNTATLSKPAHAVINWSLMISLAALYGTIVIGWIAYEQYQPKLLLQFNFSEFTLALTVAQAIILVVTPPVAGKLADRYRLTRGHRFPVISLGISFAAMVFMAVAFTLLSNPGEVFKWVLPVLIILWLVAMSIFTGPALSTIEAFIPVEKLPRAMAVLAITGNLLYALEPVIVDIIDFLGAPITFMAGGILVFLTGILLKRNAFTLLRKMGGAEKTLSAPEYAESTPRFVYIFMIGGVYGLVTALLFHEFPDTLASNIEAAISRADGSILIAGVLTVSAILSLPFSTLVSHYGLTPSFLVSLLICLSGIFGVLLIPSPYLALMALGIFVIGFTVLSISALPLAIEHAGYNNKVFCVCIFFAGAALPDGLADILASW